MCSRTFREWKSKVFSNQKIVELYVCLIVLKMYMSSESESKISVNDHNIMGTIGEEVNSGRKNLGTNLIKLKIYDEVVILFLLQ